MREEKKYLATEVSRHLEKSDYVILADYQRITVKETAELRDLLRDKDAEFHVVKNSALTVAAKERGLPEFGKLEGPTAIVIGGKRPSDVAKVLVSFHKDKEEKCGIKCGVLGERMMTAAEVVELSKLPSLEILRAQLLGLLNTPAQQMARIIQAVPVGLLNVLQAKARKGSE